MRRAGLPAPALAGIVALAALLAACGHKAVTAPPRVVAGPGLLEVSPRARSFGVVVDTDPAIWARFDRPLDPKSIDSTTVFLKVDTRRQGADISYDGFGNRIVVRPRVALSRATTYTVEMAAGVRAATGEPFGRKQWWQFTTSSLNSVQTVTPPDLSVEGPHAMLAWSGNAPRNLLSYQVYASTDSAAVARRAVPPVVTVAGTSWFPSVRWDQGQTIFWSATAIDAATGDRIDGPLARFQVLPASEPVEVDTFAISEWGAGARVNPGFRWCASATLPVNLDYNSTIKFPILANHADWRVVDATLEMSCAVISGDLQLGYAAASWTSCAITYLGAPFPVGFLPITTQVNGLAARVTGETFASFIDTSARFAGWYGFLVRSSGNWSVYVGQPGVAPPRLIVTIQRVPPRPAPVAR